MSKDLRRTAWMAAATLLLCAPMVAPDAAQALFFRRAFNRVKSAVKRAAARAKQSIRSIATRARQRAKHVRNRVRQTVQRAVAIVKQRLGRPRPGAGFVFPLVPIAPPRSYLGGPPPHGPKGWEQAHGWKMAGATTPFATTVLLVHGYTSSSAHFRAPYTAWNVRDVDFDPKAPPRFRPAALFSLSPKPRRLNFFDELSRHFRVAVWNQVPCMTAPAMPGPACLKQDTFDLAYQSAMWALRKVLDETKGPIALVGHSRGGLIARRLVHEFGTAGGRIRWFISLHAPHRGVETSRRVLGIDDFIGKLLGKLPKFIAKPILAIRGAVGSILRGGEEMSTHGSKSLFTRFLQGEKQVPGITYVTFGGTSTIVARLHRRGGPKATEISGIPGAAEARNGAGDLLVTDTAARLPWPGIRHITQPIHHFELLWHRPTIEAVTAILSGARK